MPHEAQPTPSASGGRTAPARRCVIFTLDGVDHAIPAHQVRHSLPVGEAPARQIEFLGQAFPVVDLRALFRLPGPPPADALLLLVEASGRRAALVVDRLADVVLLDEAAVVPLPTVFAGHERRWLTGLGRIGRRVLVLVQLDGLLGGVPAPAAAPSARG